MYFWNICCPWGAWGRQRHSRHTSFSLRIYSPASNFTRLPGVAYTKSQSFEFVGYYYYYFQLPFPEHPLRCRDYLRLGSLEIVLVQENAGRLFKGVLPGDALKNMKGVVRQREVVWTTATGWPFRGVSFRGQCDFSEGSCEMSVHFEGRAATALCTADVQAHPHHHDAYFKGLSAHPSLSHQALRIRCV